MKKMSLVLHWISILDFHAFLFSNGRKQRWSTSGWNRWGSLLWLKFSFEKEIRKPNPCNLDHQRHRSIFIIGNEKKTHFDENHTHRRFDRVSGTVRTRWNKDTIKKRSNFYTRETKPKNERREPWFFNYIHVDIDFHWYLYSIKSDKRLNERLREVLDEADRWRGKSSGIGDRSATYSRICK